MLKNNISNWIRYLQAPICTFEPPNEIDCFFKVSRQLWTVLPTGKAQERPQIEPNSNSTPLTSKILRQIRHGTSRQNCKAASPCLSQESGLSTDPGRQSPEAAVRPQFALAGVPVSQNKLARMTLLVFRSTGKGC